MCFSIPPRLQSAPKVTDMGIKALDEVVVFSYNLRVMLFNAIHHLFKVARPVVIVVIKSREPASAVVADPVQCCVFGV